MKTILVEKPAIVFIQLRFSFLLCTIWRKEDFELTTIRRLAPRLPYRTRAAVQNTRSSISIRGRDATGRTQRDAARLSCGSRDGGR